MDEEIFVDNSNIKKQIMPKYLQVKNIMKLLNRKSSKEKKRKRRTAKKTDRQRKKNVKRKMRKKKKEEETEGPKLRIFKKNNGRKSKVKPIKIIKFRELILMK